MLTPAATTYAAADAAAAMSRFSFAMIFRRRRCHDFHTLRYIAAAAAAAIDVAATP